MSGNGAAMPCKSFASGVCEKTRAEHINCNTDDNSSSAYRTSVGATGRVWTSSSIPSPTSGRSVRVQWASGLPMRYIGTATSTRGVAGS
jgi:hypothetical protein